MSQFPKQAFEDLFWSSYRLNKRFRSEWPKTVDALAIYIEEVNEVLDAMVESKEHLAEEIIDLFVTAMGALMIYELKFDPILGSLAHEWNGREDLKSYITLTLNSFDRVEALSELQAHDRDFRAAVTYGNLATIKSSFVHLVTCATVLFLAYGGTVQMLMDALEFVVNKNNSKTIHTHYLNLLTGKITRKGK